MDTWVHELQASISALWNAALFKTEAFTAFSGRRDVFFRGFLIIVVIALLTGLPVLVMDLVGAFRPPVEMDAAAMAELRQGLAQLDPLLKTLGISGLDLGQIVQMVETGAGIAARVDELPTILPKPLGGIFEASGAWVSRPFTSSGFPLSQALLATWLGYGIWVMLVAKLLGGRATLARFFGTTALFAAPHVLNVFAPLPILGALLGVFAFIWGVAIYVKATAVSHELSGGRALLAVVLPVAVAFTVGWLVAIGLTALVIATFSRWIASLHVVY